ncbi:MAG: hypothetical protein COB02_11515 [Candidatus Cloacimonadota bacterium]|nr:MAG: hypothetical protein COB02_11515 [Candidatus Cloacimonadota bacterium]
MIKYIIIFLSTINFLMAKCMHCKDVCKCSQETKHGGHSRADMPLPIGLMGDHMGHEGQWMATVKRMDMRMSGIYNKSNLIDVSDVHKNYMMAPLSMTNNMTMIGFMKPSKSHTWMLMFNHHDKEMLMQHRNGTKPMTVSKGMGDIALSYHHATKSSAQRKSFWSMGLSIPNGKTDEKFKNVTLPYGMQLGSGTWDFKPSFTSKVYNDNHSFGYRVSAILRNGENDDNYTLGNRYEANIWYAMNRTKRFSPSLRLNYVDQGSIDGANTLLNMMMSPMNVTTNYGYKRLSLAIGFNAVFDATSSLAVEYQLPLHQSFDGISLGLDSMIVIAYRHLF